MSNRNGMVAITLASLSVAGVAAMDECPNGPPVPPRSNEGTVDVCVDYVHCTTEVLTAGGSLCQFCTTNDMREACQDPNEVEDPPLDRPLGVPCWNDFVPAGCGLIIVGRPKFDYQAGTWICQNTVTTDLCCHKVVCEYATQ